uniref:Ig-like domain-containing protein n=1 Tax=Gopherus evgoodei TaxID=1825980 RepID=A0A8C4WIJ3_9SAUR
MENTLSRFQAIPVALCLLLGIGTAAPGSGSDPILHMAGHKDSGVWVLCLSAGWYPEPHVLWRNGRGETLSPESEQKPCSDDGLFNVSSSLVVLESSDPALTCTIRAGFSGPERETTIRITGLFPRHAPEMMAFFILLPVSLFLVPLAVYLFRKLQVLKEETSKERGEYSRHTISRVSITSPQRPSHNSLSGQNREIPPEIRAPSHWALHRHTVTEIRAPSRWVLHRHTVTKIRTPSCQALPRCTVTEIRAPLFWALPRHTVTEIRALSCWVLHRHTVAEIRALSRWVLHRHAVTEIRAPSCRALHRHTVTEIRAPSCRALHRHTVTEIRAQFCQVLHRHTVTEIRAPSLRALHRHLHSQERG